ncbi:MAG TPA: hypothetical protein VHF23_05525 [Gaiellaceae bacterium]|nr:hypothetical protein [Gaiellaceae bacterium]
MPRLARRLAPIVIVAGLALVGAAAAAAHPFSGWSGTKGPFAWEAKLRSCGVVGEEPSRVRAHTRWRLSPANGYQRLTFVRQVREEGTNAWTTVQRQRRSTRNTTLEGSGAVLHWSQFFHPFPDEAGMRSRHIVTFEWRRDRRGADRTVLTRARTLAPCTVGG